MVGIMNRKKRNYILSYCIPIAVFLVLIFACLFFTGIIKGKDTNKVTLAANAESDSTTEETTHEIIKYTEESTEETMTDDYGTWYYLGNTMTGETVKTEEAATTVTETAAEETTTAVPYTKYVFLGDSRYRGMSFCAGWQDVFIAENGQGYEYLVSSLESLKAICDNQTALIVGLGVNDCGYRAPNYIATLNELDAATDCQIYFMSVNPVDEAVEAAQPHPYKVKNNDIDSFNAQMQVGLNSNIIYIDTNAYLKSVGYATRDGLHYMDSTYQTIYDYIKAYVG